MKKGLGHLFITSSNSHIFNNADLEQYLLNIALVTIILQLYLAKHALAIFELFHMNNLLHIDTGNPYHLVDKVFDRIFWFL